MTPEEKRARRRAIRRRVPPRHVLVLVCGECGAPVAARRWARDGWLGKRDYYDCTCCGNRHGHRVVCYARGSLYGTGRQPRRGKRARA